MPEPYVTPTDEELLRLFCGGPIHPHVIHDLLSCGLFRILRKEAKRGRDIQSLVTIDEVGHICDWLRSAINSGRPWLTNVDARGRPKKMLKYGTVAALLAEVDRDMLRFARNSGNVRLNEGDEELWMGLDEGYSLVRLLTPAALDRESAQMQHCIGQGGYDSHLEKGDRVFLSLRDRQNNAHVTLELGALGTVLQMQGKQNSAPVRRYIELMTRAFFDPRIAAGTALSKIGIVMSTDGRLLDKYLLPEGITVIGDIHYGKFETTQQRAIGKPFSLPKHVTVSGDLWIEDLSIEELPSGLTVMGKLTVDAPRLRSVPVDFKAASAHFTSMDGCTFPRGMRFEGNLFFTRVRFDDFPENLRVGGSLHLRGCSFGLLPSDMRLGGSLDISHCDFEGFAEGYRAHGDLRAEFCNIGFLPENFTVEGSLDLTYSTVGSIPERAHVGRTLNVTLATFDRLPSGWHVGGSIEAGGSTLSSMTGRSVVNGDLVLADSKMEAIDEVVKVAGSLAITATAISSLADGIRVDGELDANASALACLPDGISVGGRLLLAATYIERLPDALVLSSDCDIAATPVQEIPVGFSCDGYLDISDTEIDTIPDGSRIGQLLCSRLPARIGADVEIERGIIVMGLGETFTVAQARERSPVQDVAV
jgi:hypothetical protein